MSRVEGNFFSHFFLINREKLNRNLTKIIYIIKEKNIFIRYGLHVDIKSFYIVGER